MKNSPPQRRTKARRKPKRFNGQRPILLNATLTIFFFQTKQGRRRRRKRWKTATGRGRDVK
jgi:hypothetical protein